MGGLTWLHLSDWHQGGKEFDRKVVGDALLKDLLDRTNINPDLARIDFLVFSGDIAFSGQAEEYTDAIVQLFTPVLEATGLPPDRLFIIPGNHDLDRKKFRYLPVELNQPFESEVQVQDWLADDENRKYVLSPFSAYHQFVGTFAGQNQPLFSTIRKFKIDNKQVALLGLNSALMCGRNTDTKGIVNDYGYLVVGEPQIHDALKQIVDADVRISVLHHPFGWLAEFDRIRIEEQLEKNCHFILHGHQHLPKVIVGKGTAGDCVTIPAGASYDKRIAHDPRYTNAYNLVHLDFETSEGIVYLRRWNDRQNTWQADTDSYTNGRFQFQLPKLLGRPSISNSSTLTVSNQITITTTSLNYQREKRIIERYLKALISRNADLEPGGIKQTGVQVILPLDKIYVGLQADRDRPDVDRRVMQEELDEIKKSLNAEEDPIKRERQYQIWAQQARILQQALELVGPREELSNIVQLHRQLVILGEPGSGKTTLLRYLTLRFAKAIVDDLDRILQPQNLWDENKVWRLPDLGPVRLPILIRISQYAEARQKDPDLALIDYFPRYFTGLQVPDGEELGILLRRLLNEGRCLVLLDGLDEIVDPTDRLNISTAIGQFASIFREIGLPEWSTRPLAIQHSIIGEEIESGPKITENTGEIAKQSDEQVPEEVRQLWEKQFKKGQQGIRASQIAWELLREARYAHIGNCFVVTSRIAGYHFAGVPGDFEHYTIRRMSIEDIKLFLEKWCFTVEERIAEAPEPAQVERRARKEIESILQSIDTTPGVRRMAENPLLLRILALINRTHSHLPQRRVELYETATVTLLRDWNLQRGLGQEVTIDEPIAMTLLGPIALWIHENRPTGLLTKGEVETQLSRILAREQGDNPESPSLAVKTAVELFLNKIRQYSGIFVERGEGLFGFMHLTFEEYFTARQLTSNLDRAREEILTRLHQPRWREPILLAIGRLSNQFYESTDSLLQAILDHGINDPYEEILHRNLLFAAACASDSVSVYPRRRQQISERLLALYCEHPYASRYRHLRKQIKDALLSLYNDRGDVPVEIALSMVLSRCTKPSSLSQALEMVTLLKAHTSSVAEALDTCPDLGMLPLIHQARCEVMSRMESIDSGITSTPGGWEGYRDDIVLSRLLGAIWRYGWRVAIETGLKMPRNVLVDIEEFFNSFESYLQRILKEQIEIESLDFPLFQIRRFHQDLQTLLQETENTRSPITSSELEQLFTETGRSNLATSDLQSLMLQVQQLHKKTVNRENLPEDIEQWGKVIMHNVQSGDTLIPFFADRAGQLISMQPMPDFDTMIANINSIQTNLSQAILDSLQTTSDSLHYYEAAVFLFYTSEELRKDVLSIILTNLERAGVKRRLALQVLTNVNLHANIKFTETQYSLLIKLMDGPIDQAYLALNVLFDQGLTPALLTWCWSTLRHIDHPLTDNVIEKLSEIEEVEGTSLILDLLDKGRKDPILRPFALDLLHKIAWRGSETLSRALIWLQDESDSLIRFHAAVLLTKHEDVLIALRIIFLEATREQLKVVQTSQKISWAVLNQDPQAVRLLSTLWVQNWDNLLTQLWVGQSALDYVDQKHPSKTWQNFRTYPDSKEIIRWLLKKATFGQETIPFFQEVTQELLELEHDNVRQPPKAEHITRVLEMLSSRWAASPYIAGLLPVIPLRQVLANADHPLTFWVCSQLAYKGLKNTAPPVTLAPLLVDNNASIRAAAALTLLSADLPILLLKALVEAAQESDDRLRKEAENNLYDFCSKLPSDGSTEGLDWLIHFSPPLEEQNGAYLTTLVSTASAQIFYNNPAQVSQLLESTSIKQSQDPMEDDETGIFINMASSDVVSLLCAYVKDENKSHLFRIRALDTLQELVRGNIVSRSKRIIIATLTSALSDSSVHIRRDAAYTLQWATHQDAWIVAQDLLKTIQKDTDSQTRVLALRSLGRVLQTLKSILDRDISKEALFRWLIQESSKYGMENIIRKIWNQPVITKASHAGKVLKLLSHPNNLGLSKKTITFLREEENWNELLANAQAEWNKRTYGIKILPKLPAPIAEIENLLANTDSTIRRATECALARVLQDEEDRPFRLEILLRNSTEILWAMVDAAAIADHNWNSSNVSAVEQISRWIDGQQSTKKSRLIDTLLDELADQIIAMEHNDQEKDSEQEVIDYESGWPLLDVITSILSDLSERLTYRAFIHSHDLAEVIHFFTWAARHHDSYMTRQFAIRALGNLQQYTSNVAEVFFEACKDVDEVYREARKAVVKFKFFGPGSLEKLTSALRNPSTVIAYHAAILLGELGVSRSEELGFDKRKYIADQLISILEDPLSKRVVHNLENDDGTVWLYDIIYESLVRVVAGPDAEITTLTMKKSSWPT